MSAPAPGGAARDDAALQKQGRALAKGIEAALPGWVERCVERVLTAFCGQVDEDARRAAREAGLRAQQEVGPKVRALLEQDVDEQRSTPLALLRTAIVYPAAVLRAAGVPPVVRDRFAEERFPDDDFDLTPASFADIDPALTGPGLEWGAAKAWEHRRRHGGGGR